MAYEVEVSDEFRGWYEPLSEAEQLSIGRVIELLEEKGTALAFPYSSGIQGSKLSTCANSGFNTRAGRTGCSMPSIQPGPLFCW